MSHFQPRPYSITCQRSPTYVTKSRNSVNLSNFSNNPYRSVINNNEAIHQPMHTPQKMRPRNSTYIIPPSKKLLGPNSVMSKSLNPEELSYQLRTVMLEEKQLPDLHSSQTLKNTKTRKSASSQQLLPPSDRNKRLSNRVSSKNYNQLSLDLTKTKILGQNQNDHHQKQPFKVKSRSNGLLNITNCSSVSGCYTNNYQNHVNPTGHATLPNINFRRANSTLSPKEINKDADTKFNYTTQPISTNFHGSNMLRGSVKSTTISQLDRISLVGLVTERVNSINLNSSLMDAVSVNNVRSSVHGSQRVNFRQKSASNTNMLHDVYREQCQDENSTIVYPNFLINHPKFNTRKGYVH